MNKKEIVERISNGEDSYTQFKEQIVTSKDLAKEFVAFANSVGGIIIFGVNGDEEIQGLNKAEVEKIGQLVGNVGQENVKPPIHPLIQNFTIDNLRIVVVFVDSGASKPYKTSSGIYYTKSGADKKIMSDEELKRIFSESKRLYADEETLPKSDISDLNSELFMQFLKKDNEKVYNDVKIKKLSLSKVLENRELLNNNHLTLAGNLIFGLEPQRFCPLFYVDCCYFDGNNVAVTKYISQKRLKGTFSNILDGSVNFVTTSLRNYQIHENFNSNPKLEIDERILIELIVNALIHRDFYINSSIKIFIFHNRIEIISPGKLINSLTVDKIKSGLSIPRNPILASICRNVLPFTGYGSGIARVIELDPTIEFVNDIDMEQFKSIISREKLGEKPEKLGERAEKLGEKPGKLGERAEKLGENKTIKLSKNRKLILELILKQPKITIDILSNEIGISTTSIEKNLQYLKENNCLKRVGGAKGGKWEIICIANII